MPRPTGKITMMCEMLADWKKLLVQNINKGTQTASDSILVQVVPQIDLLKAQLDVLHSMWKLEEHGVFVIPSENVG